MRIFRASYYHTVDTSCIHITRTSCKFRIPSMKYLALLLHLWLWPSSLKPVCARMQTNMQTAKTAMWRPPFGPDFSTLHNSKFIYNKRNSADLMVLALLHESYMLLLYCLMTAQNNLTRDREVKLLWSAYSHVRSLRTDWLTCYCCYKA